MSPQPAKNSICASREAPPPPFPPLPLPFFSGLVLEAACGNGLASKELATWADLMANYKSPKFIFGKIDPSAWARPDVMPSVVMYTGIGGLSKGSIVRKGNKWVVCALAIDGDEEVAQVHQWNNPPAVPPNYLGGCASISGLWTHSWASSTI